MAGFSVALWGVFGASAQADWKVRRSPTSARARGAEMLRIHPADAAAAARVFRSLGPADEAALLLALEQRAHESGARCPAQLAFAQALLAVLRWSDAALEFEKAVSLCPSDAAPRLGRASALARQGDLRSALAELRLAAEGAGDGQGIVRVARGLIAAASEGGDVIAEVGAREELVRVRPDDRERMELASALGRAGRPAEAAAVVAATLPNGGPAAARRGLVEATYRVAAADWDGAWTSLAIARRRAARGPRALREELWTMTIEVARRTGQLEALRQDLARPRDIVEWLARARLSDEQGDLRDSVRALSEAIRRAPGDINLRLRRLDVAKLAGRGDDIASLYEDLVAASERAGEPAAPVALDALDGLRALGRVALAGRLFDRLLAGARGRVGALKALGDLADRWADDRRAARTWAEFLRRAPRNELAIIALGEVQFRGGRREAGIETWRRLLRGQMASAGAHARLAEVLLDHDLYEKAASESRVAIRSSPTGQLRYWRLLATILERQPLAREAQDAWETVLRLARGAAVSPERREARSRLIALWQREGNARVETKLRELRESVRIDPADRAALVFLVEAQIRTGRSDAAIASLRQALAPVVSTGSVALQGGEGGNGERRIGAEEAASDADLILLLVRTLRQTQRAGEAAPWLEELSRRYPGSVRDAGFQLADIAFAAHADRRAQDLAKEAVSAAPHDIRLAMRAAALQERLGRFDEARLSYRLLIDTTHDFSATLALAALLGRLGEVDEQRTMLREVVGAATDDEVVAEAGRRAIAVEEAGGSLDALASAVIEAPDLDSPSGLARRRVLAAVLGRLVPSLYRSQADDAAARASLERLRHGGVKALLDLSATVDAELAPAIVETLGMLGRAEVASTLARVVNVDAGGDDLVRESQAAARPSDELLAVTVIALGRIGGEVARGAIERLARQFKPVLRGPLLWALGRVGAPLGITLGRQELIRGPIDTAVVACLTLGRLGGPAEASLLATVASEPLRPRLVRRAAILGLALGRHAVVVPSLSRLTQIEDQGLSQDAVIALKIFARTSETSQAMARGWRALPDEAHAISGSRIDPDALVRALERL